MKRMTNIALIVVLFVTSILGGNNAKKIIGKFQKKYKKFDFIEVKYTERNKLSMGGITQQTNGYLVMAKDNRFKLITDQQQMSLDGKNFYRLNKINNQLTIDYVKQSDELLIFQKMFYHVEEYYYVNLIDEIKMDKTQIFVLKLINKDEGNQLFKEIKVWLKNKSWEVLKLEITDLNDNQMIYEIKELNTKKKFEDNFFTIKPENETEVIDLRI